MEVFIIYTYIRANIRCIRARRSSTACCGSVQEARAAAEQEAVEVKQRLASAEEAAARQAVERDAETAARDARALQDKTREVAALRTQHDAYAAPSLIFPSFFLFFPFFYSEKGACT